MYFGYSFIKIIAKIIFFVKKFYVVTLKIFRNIIISETITSKTRKPVSLSFNPKASEVCVWSPCRGMGVKTPTKTGGIGGWSQANVKINTKILDEKKITRFFITFL